jgi:hypothetical protein
MELASIVAELARGLLAADALRLVARSQRGTRIYQPRIGPHAENAAIALALATFTSQAVIGPWGQFAPYSGCPRQECDLSVM